MSSVVKSQDKSRKVVIAAAALSIFISSGSASAEKIIKKIKSYSIGIEKSRVIYNESSDKGVSVAINNKNEYPVLAVSQLFNEHKKESEDYIVTPPLIKIEPKQATRIKLIRSSQAIANNNQESLHWLCITGVPPANGDSWNLKKEEKNTTYVDVKIKVKECIKMIYRPIGLPIPKNEDFANILWAWDGDSLLAKNKTPYYISIKKLTTNAESINHPQYICPYCTVKYKLKGNMKPYDVEWTVINDFGGVSGPYKLAI